MYKLITDETGRGVYIFEGDADGYVIQDNLWQNPAHHLLVVNGEVTLSIPAPSLEAVQLSQLNRLHESFNAEMAAGFTSNALGTPHSYDGEEHNQINLLGIKMRGQGGLFTCDDMQGNADSKQRRQHTAQQIDQVFTDGYAVKEALIDKLRNKRAAVNGAETPEAVAAITWDSVE